MRELGVRSVGQRDPLTLEQCDPHNVIGQALTTPSIARPHDVFLAWLLGLPIGIDAAQAARVLVSVHQDEGISPSTAMIIDLLRQAAVCIDKSPKTTGCSRTRLH